MSIHNKRMHAEILRAIQGNKYEKTETGIEIPSMKLSIGGHFETSINNGPWDIDPNLVTTEGLTHFLSVTLAQGTQKTAFYIALFSGNVTVPATWNGVNFTANSTEFINYTEANRVLWAKDAAAAGVINNNTTPAVFTMNTGGGTVRGAALIEAQAKSAVTGVLVAASRFATDKTLGVTDELRVKYGITATST